MKNYALVIAATLLLGSAFLATESIAQTPAELRGKTYIAFLEGQFDDNPNFASGFKLTFDKAGNPGILRGMSAYKPEDKNAEQSSSIFTCGVYNGNNFFYVKNSEGGDQGECCIRFMIMGQKYGLNIPFQAGL